MAGDSEAWWLVVGSAQVWPRLRSASGLETSSVHKNTPSGSVAISSASHTDQFSPDWPGTRVTLSRSGR